MPRIEPIPGVILSKQHAKEIAPWARHFRKIDGVWTGYESDDDFGRACLPDSWDVMTFHPYGIAMDGGHYAPSKQNVLDSLDSDCPLSTPRSSTGCIGNRCGQWENGPCAEYRG